MFLFVILSQLVLRISQSAVTLLLIAGIVLLTKGFCRLTRHNFGQELLGLFATNRRLNVFAILMVWGSWFVCVSAFIMLNRSQPQKYLLVAVLIYSVWRLLRFVRKFDKNKARIRERLEQLHEEDED